MSLLMIIYRIANWLYRHHIPVLPRLIYIFEREFLKCSIPASCKIGGGTKLAYGGIGIVIHARCVIGRNCVIGQGATLGGKSRWYEVPVLGDNVYVSAGARILGPIRIGNNVVIGANAVVVKDVPDNCVVAGVPAKIIKENVPTEEFYGTDKLRYRGDNGWPVTPKA